MEITWHRKGITLLIPRSKADQEGEGREVEILLGVHDQTCPVMALEELAQDLGRRVGTNLPPRRPARERRRRTRQGLDRADRETPGQAGEARESRILWRSFAAGRIRQRSIWKRRHYPRNDEQPGNSSFIALFIATRRAARAISRRRSEKWWML